jgi:hypothetical protein
LIEPNPEPIQSGFDPRFFLEMYDLVNTPESANATCVSVNVWRATVDIFILRLYSEN